MSLEERIAAFRSKFLSQVPEEIQHLMHGAEVRLEESGAALRAIKTGDRAPGFDLPNAHGETVSSRELLARGPVVLSFYRGDWCPYCNLELKALQERVAEIEALGARLVAVSPQTPDATTDTAARNKLTFEVLSDTGNTVAKSFGLDFELAEELRPIYKNWGADLEKLNGDPPFSLPMAATYVIGSDGTIIESFVDTDYTERMEPQAIIDALKR
jgi:peroxiredoxin